MRNRRFENPPPPRAVHHVLASCVRTVESELRRWAAGLTERIAIARHNRAVGWCQPSPVARLTNKSIALVGLGFMVPPTQRHKIVDLSRMAERVVPNMVDLYGSRVNATGYLTSFISVFKGRSNN